MEVHRHPAQSHVRTVPVAKARATASPPPLAGEGIGDLRPPFLVPRTPMRRIGYGGGTHDGSCKPSPSPTLPRKRGREHAEFAARPAVIT
jgi:hypothetical protein